MVAAWFSLATKADVTVTSSGRHRRRRTRTAGRFAVRWEAIVTGLCGPNAQTQASLVTLRKLTSVQPNYKKTRDFDHLPLAMQIVNLTQGQFTCFFWSFQPHPHMKKLLFPRSINNFFVIWVDNIQSCCCPVITMYLQNVNFSWMKKKQRRNVCDIDVVLETN